MATRRIAVELKGISPLLMHAFPNVAIEAVEKKTPEEQAEFSAYRVPTENGTRGELYVPGINVQRGLVAAATFSKGKGRASLQKSAAACLMLAPERLLLGTTQYEVDARPVVIPATKGRVMRYRPRLDHWKIAFTLEYDDTLLSEKQVRQIVDDMGSRVGILDFRPERKGPFGRGMVTNWEHL